MSITAGAATAGVSVNANTLVIAHAVVAGAGNRVLVLGLGNRFDETALSVVSDVGGAFTKVIRHPNSTAQSAELWILKDAAVGTHTVTVTTTTGPARMNGALVTLFGVDQTTTVRAAASAAVTSATPSVVATTLAGDLVVDVLAGKAPVNTLVVGAGQTDLHSSIGDNTSANAVVFGFSFEEATGVSTTMSWTRGTSDSNAIVGVPFIPAAIAAPGRLTTCLAA